MKYINKNIHFGMKPNINNLKSYLSKYHIVTEINADFLGVADPTEDKNVSDIVNKLNDDDDRYEPMAPMTNEGTLKCIFDAELISAQKLSKIAKLLYSNY